MGCGCGGSTPQAPLPVGHPDELPTQPAPPKPPGGQRVVGGHNWTGDPQRTVPQGA